MILVAGGSGRLGQVLVNRLLARGETVRVLARHRRNLGDGVDMVQGDVRDLAEVARAETWLQLLCEPMRDSGPGDHIRKRAQSNQLRLGSRRRMPR